MMKILTSATTILMVVILASCDTEPAVPAIVEYDCAGTSPTYSFIIKPILDANCATAGCHASANYQSDVDLSNYAAAKVASQKDEFRGSIQHISGFEAMPDGGTKLDENTIKIISCWVQNGSPE